ncbi:unnamed protein product, partial [Staurois parvus]
MSVPKAVTPSYTRAYRAALHRDSLQSLPCPAPALPRCVPCSVPRPSPPADAGIQLLCSGSCDVGMYGRRRRRKILKNFIFFSKQISHMLCPVPCLNFVCSF